MKAWVRRGLHGAFKIEDILVDYVCEKYIEQAPMRMPSQAVAIAMEIVGEPTVPEYGEQKAFRLIGHHPKDGLPIYEFDELVTKALNHEL